MWDSKKGEGASLRPPERKIYESAAYLTEKLQAGLDAFADHSSGRAVLCHLLLWPHVWDIDGF